VSFTSRVSGGTAPYDYSWSFGDGSSSSEDNPVHVFSRSGVQRVTLTVTDSRGTTATSNTVRIGVAAIEITLEDYTYKDKTPTEWPALILGAGGIVDTAVYGDLHVIFDQPRYVREANVEVIAEYVEVGSGEKGTELREIPLAPSGEEHVAVIRIETGWPAEIAAWLAAVFLAVVLKDPGDFLEGIVDTAYDMPGPKTAIGFERIYTGAMVARVIGVDTNGKSFEIPMASPLELKSTYEHLADWARDHDHLYVFCASPVALSVVDRAGNRIGAFHGQIIDHAEATYYFGEPGKPQTIVAVGPDELYRVEIEGIDQGTYTLHIGYNIGGDMGENLAASDEPIQRGTTRAYEIEQKGGVYEIRSVEWYTTWTIPILLGVCGLAVVLAMGFRKRTRTRHRLFCPECGASLRPAARYCLKCGQSVRRVDSISVQAGGLRRNVFCLKCGNQLRPHSKFCLKCGEQVHRSPGD